MDRITSSLALIAGRLRDIYNAQSMTNRLIAGAAVLALLIGIGTFAAFRLRGPDYGVLFSNLSSDEANAVVVKLQAENIPHRLANNGTTVLVPMDKVADERVALAGTGVVKGGSAGFELFDKTNLGMTDFQEKIAKVRATEGELQRTISSLTPVESARVHIAVPEASLYSSTQSPTTASIAVKTKPGMQLSPDEVRGITALTTGAVENLKPENVTIVNQDGNVLVPSAVGGDLKNNPLAAAASALRLTQDQLLAKQRWESNLQSNIQGLLDDAIGSKRSAVRVAADMNFDAGSTDSTTYGQGQVLSEQRERESATGIGGTRNPAVGVPGTTTNNVPTYQAAPPQNANGRYTKSKATVNYKVPEQKVSHVDAPGKVQRLSVAVLVNVPTGAAANTTNGTATYTVAAADVAKIRNVVAAAAGIDPARGDQVSVEAIPFAPAPGSGIQTVTAFGGIPLNVLIALAILALMGVGGAVIALRRRSAVAAASAAGAELPTFDSTLAEELPSFEEHPMLDGLTPSLAAPIRSAADLTREQMIEYVTTVAQENPDSIAKLIKLWLAEA